MVRQLKYKSVLIIMIMATSCHRFDGPYRNMEKWRLTGRDGTSLPLRGMPVQVTEYIFPAEDSANPEKWRRNYQRYFFDTIGNLIASSSYAGDTLMDSIQRRFDENGMQEKLTHLKTGKVTETTCRRLADGRFKMIHTHLSGKPVVSLYSFSPDGSETIREDYSDTAAKGKPTRTAHLYYEDYYKLVKITASVPDGSFEIRSYYRHAYAPDSTLSYSGTGFLRKLTQRVVYHNDHLENPVFQMTVSNAERGVKEYSYRYDKSGNWVRRVVTELNNKAQNEHYAKSTVTVREIVY